MVKAFVIGAIVGMIAILVVSLFDKGYVDAPDILAQIVAFGASVGLVSLIAYAIIDAVAKNDSNKTKWKKSIIIAFVLCVIFWLVK